MDIADIRAKTLDELKDELETLKKEQFNMRFQRATQQMENTSHVRRVRREVAKVKTVMREKRES